MRKQQHILILTGAGISADSGIATFRAADGLWENHPVEEVATPEGYARNPQLVQRFYNERRAELLSPHIVPNAAHIALAKLERYFEKNGCGTVTIVTQNIDNLHERGGSNRVWHMHGELLKLRCPKSEQLYEWATDEPVTEGVRCECCQPSLPLRPHIVWFGEMPLYMDEIAYQLAQANLFVAIGTSGNVYPAAGFVAEANALGIPTLAFNLEASNNSTLFDETIYGRAAETIPQWVEEVMAENGKK